MWKCIRCEKENQDSAEKCASCGHERTMDYIQYRTLSKVSETTSVNWKRTASIPEGIEKPVLMADEDSTTVFGSKILRKNIREIEFVKVKKEKVPSGAWDVSEDKKKTIQAWTESTDKGLILKIGSENGVYANPNCKSLFSGYSNVKKIEFNHLFDTSKAICMEYMFYECRELEDIDVSRFNTGNVTDMAGMFAFDNKLKKLDMSQFDTGKVTDMAGMFADCFVLESLQIDGFDTGEVLDMSNMFQDCSGLKEINTSGFITGNVVEMGSMFMGCSGLKEINTSGFDTGNVINMEYIFSDCENLVKIDTSKFITDKVSDITNLFEGCKKLGNMEILNSVELNERKIHRNYAGNNVETICKKFLSYKDTEIVNNALNNKKVLINVLQIEPGDKIYILHDTSLFRRGKSGFAVTDKGIYVKEPWQDTQVVYWKDFKKYTKITRDGGAIIADGKAVAHFSGSKEVLLQLEVMFDAIHKCLNHRILG